MKANPIQPKDRNYSAANKKADKITLDAIRRTMPRSVRENIKQPMVDKINNLVLDSTFREAYLENLVGFTSVLAEGKYKMVTYVDAVRYVSHKLQGDTNITAYVKTFPERYQRMVDDGYEEKNIHAMVNSFNKTGIVMKIFEQSMIPTHILNAGLYQDALNVQADLMHNADSEKVRTEAANSLLVQLKAPETRKIEIDIGISEDKSIQELRNTTLDLVAQQKKMIKAGVNTVKEIAHSKLLIEEVVVEGEIVE